MKIIAEGVETDGQLNLLSSLDCDIIQGFLLGRPMSASSMVNVLTSPVAPPPNSHRRLSQFQTSQRTAGNGRIGGPLPPILPFVDADDPSWDYCAGMASATETGCSSRPIISLGTTCHMWFSVCAHSSQQRFGKVRTGLSHMLDDQAAQQIGIVIGLDPLPDDAVRD